MKLQPITIRRSLSLAALLCLTPNAFAQPASTQPATTRPATTRAVEQITPILTPVLGPSVKPWDDALPLTSIAFGSCVRQNRPQPIWQAINTDKPDLFLFLGDNIYGDSTDMGILRAKYAQLLAVPGFVQLRTSSTVLATWDDHDFGQNDAGVEFPAKVGAQEQFHNFWGDPADSELRTRQGVYRSRLFGPEGKRVQVILLDTRYFRSPLVRGERSDFGAYLPSPDPEATVLGAEQWAWLEAQLRVSADLRLIGTSIQLLADGHRFEKWGNFPAERKRMLDLLAKTDGALLVLSGDRHSGEFSKLDQPNKRALFDLTSSALNQGTGGGNPDAEPNPLRSTKRINLAHYGLINIDWQTGRVGLGLRDAAGHTLITTETTLKELGGR